MGVEVESNATSIPVQMLAMVNPEYSSIPVHVVCFDANHAVRINNAAQTQSQQFTATCHMSHATCQKVTKSQK